MNTNTIDLYKDELDKLNAFNTPLPKFVLDIANIIADPRIDLKMKISIAISEIVLFISQFRRSIRHYNTSLIPINHISFCIAPSGVGKDSSINAIRRSFKLGYDEINTFRKDIAINKAINKAIAKKKAKANDPLVYSEFYEEPYPLIVAPSTIEGFIAHLNRFDSDKIGAGFIYSGEFASELLTSPVIIPILQLLSEMYDEGKKEVKVLKTKESQSKEIHNLPVSGMFMSSPDVLIYDEAVKKRFKLEFS